MNTLKSGNFSRLLAGSALSTTGDAVLQMLLVWQVLERKGPAATCAIFVAAAAARLLGPFAGRIIDCDDVWGIVATSCLVRGALAMGFMMMDPLTIADHAEVIAFVIALPSLFYSPALSKSIPKIVAKELIQKANASLGLATMMASALGAAICGGMFSSVGSHKSAAVAAAIFILSGAFTISVRATADARNFLTRDLAVIRRDGWRIFARSPSVLMWGALSVVLNLLLTPVNIALAPLIQSFGSGPEVYGVTIALFIFGAIGGNYFTLRRRTSDFSGEGCLRPGLIIISLCLSAAGFCRTPISLAPIMFTLGAALPLCQVPIMTRLQNLIPPNSAGEAFGTLASIIVGVSLLAAAFGGLLLAKLNPGRLFMIAGCLGAVSTLAWSLRAEGNYSIFRARTMMWLDFVPNSEPS